MKYVFDIDGTICTQLEEGRYDRSVPIKERIEKINKLFEDGHEITFYTARGMGRFQGNVAKVYSEFFSLTENQLKEWGVKYHQLVLGKPAGDYYIDDKGIHDVSFFG
jgi:capsule biosynthesis phosphatase